MMVLLVAFLLAVWTGWLLVVGGVWSPTSAPKIDFLAFWTASSLALSGHAADAYEAGRVWQEQQNLPGASGGYMPWLNPPMFFFFVLPLSLLPVAAALGAWVSATGALAFSAVRRITDDRRMLLLAVGFHATFTNVLIGQNGLLTAGLLAWGMLLLHRKPIAAGAVLGLVCYKPQFLPLILVALLASDRRQALASAVSCIAVLSLSSLLAFGFAAWEGFFAWVFRAGDALYDGTIELAKVQSMTALMLLSGASPLLAQAVQAGVALAAAGFVAWLWRSSAAMEYKGAGLALAMVLATPYSYGYDMTLLGLALLWLAVRFKQEGWVRWEAAAMMVAWLSPLLAVLAARDLNLSLGPFVILLVMALLVRRVRRQKDAALAGGVEGGPTAAVA